jgi:DNA polymerase I-like protein with 3'-5' exonuclease and polymerase domains
VDHWLPQLVVRAKSRWDASEKFVGTFVKEFAHLGRLHASINQFRSEDGGTRTYRFSYSDPPLQQMPNRDDELATLIRGAFLPEEGSWWLAADYSQQEYRLIVHYAELHDMAKSHEAGDRYRNDPRTDFHSMVAEMTGLERKPAKDSNFAKSYGAGIPKFAAMINKTIPEAAAIMEQYDRELPFNRELNEFCQKKAERTGYLRLLDGARIHFEDWEPRWLSRDERAEGWRAGSPWKMGPCRLAEARERVETRGHPWYHKQLRRANCRKAMNALIQGGAARQTKMAMRECHRAGYVPLIQMHDELGFPVTSERDGARITEIMRDVVKLRVPMLVDAEYGRDWGSAKNSWKDRNVQKTVK